MLLFEFNAHFMQGNMDKILVLHSNKNLESPRIKINPRRPNFLSLFYHFWGSLCIRDNLMTLRSYHGNHLL